MTSKTEMNSSPETDVTAGDDMRAMIEAEIEKQNPKEECLRALVLLAEPSVKRVKEEGRIALQVVDSKGEPRTKVEGSVTVPFTVTDLAIELRANYPSLFKAEEPIAVSPEAPAGPPVRDWLFVTAEKRDRIGHETVKVVEESEITRRQSFKPQQSFKLLIPHIAAGAHRVKSLARVPQGWSLPRKNRASGADAGIRSTEAAAPLPRAPTIPPGFSPRPSHALYAALALLVGGALAYGLLSRSTEPRSDTTAAVQPSSKVEPSATGAVEPPGTKPQPPTVLTGIPEVVDTSTLRVNGKVVHLYGLEWARGGQAEDLTHYLSGREVSCKPSNRDDIYRCEVDGRDVSEVVVFNGGARATADAGPELKSLEAQARANKMGVWSKP